MRVAVVLALLLGACRKTPAVAESPAASAAVAPPVSASSAHRPASSIHAGRVWQGSTPMPCLARATGQVELSLRDRLLREDCGLAEVDFARASTGVDAGTSLTVAATAISRPRCLRAVGSTTSAQPTVLLVKDGQGRVLARSAGRSLLIAPAAGPLCVPPGVSLEAHLEDLGGLQALSGRLSLVEVH